MNKTVKLLLRLAVSVGVFVFIFFKFDLNFRNLFVLCNYRFLLLACAVRMFISPIISMNRWRTFLRYSGIEESFFSLLKISMMSSFLGIVLPSSQGQDVMRMILIEKKHPNKTITSSSTVVVERIVGFVILAFTGLVFSLVMGFPDKWKIVALIGTINLALWLLILIFTNGRIYNRINTWLDQKIKKGRVLSFADRLYYSLSHFPYSNTILVTGLLILLYQLSTVVVVYMVFFSFGVNLPFAQHLAFYPIIAILSIIPVSISGFGLREGFFVTFYSLVGVSPEIAVSVSLVNYCIEVLLYALFGGVIYLVDSIKKPK